MIVAVDLPFMFVVAVLSAKDCRAHGTGEMFNMILALKRSDVGASERATTLEAKKVKASEVVSLAEWILTVAVLMIHWEEL